MPSRKRIAERKQNNVHHKEKKTKHTVLCHCVSSQITLAAPRLGAEDGIGRTTKKNVHEKPTVPCLSLADRLPRPWVEGTEEEKQTNEQKGTTPGPALSGGVGRTRKKTHEPSCPPQSHKRRPKPDMKIPKHLKQPKETDEDLNTQKAPGATQGENANPKTQKLPETIKGGEPGKPENCRARRRRESQLIMAAPLVSSTLRWPPERKRWLREPAGIKNLAWPPLRSCGAPGKEGA